MDNVVKVGVVTFSAVIGFIGAIFILFLFFEGNTIANYEYEKLIVMSVGIVGAILCSIISIKYLRKLPKSKNLKTSLQYIILGVLLFVVGVSLLFSTLV